MVCAENSHFGRIRRSAVDYVTRGEVAELSKLGYSLLDTRYKRNGEQVSSM
jgi:hypothetical protein